jgi:hypothetical protein
MTGTADGSGSRYAAGMKRLTLLCALLGGLSAACNTSKTGANDRLSFTPVDCGDHGAGGCDFDDSIGVGGTVSVTLDSLDGTATAGLDLASADPSVLTVVPTADIGGEPAWDLTAVGPGVARLAAIDPDATEIDFVEVSTQDVTGLTMEPLVGSPVGPTQEGDYDEAFTVNADTAYSWVIRPLIAGDAITMGRFSYETVLNQGDPDITLYEAENSDRPNGYLYVTLPAGDYPVEFQLSQDPDNIYVSAIIHAQ